MVKLREFLKNISDRYIIDLRFELYGHFYLMYILLGLLGFYKLDNFLIVLCVLLFIFYLLPNFVIKVISKVCVYFYSFLFKSDKLVKFFFSAYGLKYIFIKEEPWVGLLVVYLNLLNMGYDFILIKFIRFVFLGILFFGSIVWLLIEIYNYYLKLGLVDKIEMSDIELDNESKILLEKFPQDSEEEQKAFLNYVKIEKEAKLKIEKLLFRNNNNNKLFHSTVPLGVPVTNEARGITQILKITAKSHPKITLGTLALGGGCSFGGYLWLQNEKSKREVAVEQSKVDQYYVLQHKRIDQTNNYINNCLDKKMNVDPYVVKELNQTLTSVDRKTTKMDDLDCIIENNELNNSWFDVVILTLKKLLI